ncbi:MAG: Uma2 family endonuclease [Blastocatellia bacterium]
MKKPMSRALRMPDPDLPDVEIDVSAIVTEDDTPVDNLFSEKQQRLLTEPLYSNWTGLRDERGRARKFLVAANVGLFPAINQPPLVPDVFLSLDVQVAEDWYSKNHRTYFFWEFGKPPEVVIEIVSNRRGHEASGKLRDYARIGVPYYVIHDPMTLLGDEPLRMYERAGAVYKRLADQRLPEIGLGLKLWTGKFEGKKAAWLRWCDMRNHLIPTGAERAQREAERTREAARDAKREAERARHESERARQESERADAEKQRADQLAARLRAMGVDPDQL